MNSSLILLISISVILLLVRLKVPVGFSVLAGCVLLILSVIPFSDVPSLLLRTLVNSQTWQLFIIVPCALAFSSLMDQKGMLSRLAGALEHVGPRLAVHMLPMVIGLVPMPAGALVAATGVKGLAERLKLTPERITFINYWFRHIWEFSFPIYPAIIITSTVLSISISSVMKVLLPMTGVAIALGAIISYRMLRSVPAIETKKYGTVKDIFVTSGKAAWPILLLITLIFLKVEAWIAFPVVLIALAVQQRANLKEINKAAKYGLNPLILLLLLAVMLYQMTIKESDAAAVLVSKMLSLGLPSLLMLVGMPLVLGVAIGYGPAITGIVMPLLLPFIITSSGLNSQALLVAYVSGMVGQLLSPSHLCFCFSAAYFKTSLGSIYRYTIPLLAIIEAGIIIISLIF